LDFKKFIDILPLTGRIMAIDWGSKRTGVAVTDSGREFVFPRPAVLPGDIAVEDDFMGILIGLPAPGKTADRIMEFAEGLTARTDIPILMYNEALTSSAAEGRLHDAGINSKNQKGRLDSVAALVMLEEFLGRLKNEQ